MQKSKFPDFRFPAYNLPSKCPYSLPLSLPFSNPYLSPASNLPKTDTKALKSTLITTQQARPESSTSCQTDFFEGFIKHLEKETLTEPRMKFIEVKDIDQQILPDLTQWGILRLEEPKQKFLTVDEITLVKPPNPLKKTEVVQTVEIEEPIKEEKFDEEKERLDKLAKDPIGEIKQTHEYKMNQARARLEKIEEGALKLENEMKMQNEHLDRLNLSLDRDTEKEKKKLAVNFINKVIQSSEAEEKNCEDTRVNKLFSDNQQLYDRIQRALTPKIKEPVEEPERDGDTSLEQIKRASNVNPVVSKRISEAMKTAATAIQVSKKSFFNPTVLKKPKK